MIRVIKGIKRLVAAVAVCVAAYMVQAPLTGCGTLQPPTKYVPGQQYGDGGATACMNGVCPVISQGKQWLKPCP